MRRALSLVAIASVLCAGSVRAQTAPATSLILAQEVLRVCIDTANDPATIRRLAETEKWQPLEPAAVPVRNRVIMGGKKKSDDHIHERSAAWTYVKDGLPITVGLFDIPGLAPAMGRQCEVMAWDLDQAQVDAAIRTDPRVSDNSLPLPGLPMKAYRIASLNLNINYIAGDTGLKVLHTFTVR